MHHGEHMLEDVMTKKSAFLFCSGCVAMLLASLLAAPQGFAQQQQQQTGTKLDFGRPLTAVLAVRGR